MCYSVVSDLAEDISLKQFELLYVSEFFSTYISVLYELCENCSHHIIFKFWTHCMYGAIQFKLNNFSIEFILITM